VFYLKIVDERVPRMKKTTIVSLVFALLFSISMIGYTSAEQGSKEEQGLSIRMNLYGYSLVTFLEEYSGIIANYKTTSLVTDSTYTHQFLNKLFNKYKTNKFMLIRYYGGLWEAKIDQETGEMKLTDFMTENNCLKADGFGRCNYKRVLKD
jgi:hypothetical protein